MAKTKRYLILFRENRRNARKRGATNFHPLGWSLLSIDFYNRIMGYETNFSKLNKNDRLDIYTKTQAEKLIETNKIADKKDHDYQKFEYRLLELSNYVGKTK